MVVVTSPGFDERSGYSVLVVNPHCRTHKGVALPDGGSFRDPAIRELLMPHVGKMTIAAASAT
ncbi:MAG: hypothetical protein AAF004_10080 [Pseudomonadota bacterium]